MVSGLLNDSSQQGQALSLSLLLMFLGCLALLASYESGRLVLAKSRLSYATDAAAYSAAVVQARGLNTHAYLNRAQFAHQVAMAHLITMASGAKFIGTQAKQSMRRNPPASLIAAFFGPSYAQSYVASKAFPFADTALLPMLENAYLLHDREMHGVIAQTRQALLTQLQDERNQVIESVLYQNLNNELPLKDQKSSLSALKINFEISEDELDKALQLNSGTADEWHQTLKKITNKFGYLGDRNHVQTNWWLILPRCFLPRPVLQRRGHTVLNAKGDWYSSDNQSFHALRYNQIIGCYRREYPMGWGAAGLASAAHRLKDVDQAPADFSKESFWKWSKRMAGVGWDYLIGSDNRVAASWARQNATIWSGSGMPNYASLADHTNEVLGFQLHVKRELRALWTGMIDLKAAARGQTYFDVQRFESPKSGNYANLFQASWHARLGSDKSKK